MNTAHLAHLGGSPRSASVDAFAAHLYSLNSLIHLTLGIYLQIRPQVAQRVFQYLGSTLLVISSGFLLWAFITETYQLQHFSDLSRYGINTSLAGVIAHLIGGVSLPARGK